MLKFVNDPSFIPYRFAKYAVFGIIISPIISYFILRNVSERIFPLDSIHSLYHALSFLIAWISALLFFFLMMVLEFKRSIHLISSLIGAVALAFFLIFIINALVPERGMILVILIAAPAATVAVNSAYYLLAMTFRSLNALFNKQL